MAAEVKIFGGSLEFSNRRIVFDGYHSGFGTNWPLGRYSVRSKFTHPADGSVVEQDADITLQ